MPYTMEEFRHDYLKQHVSVLSPEERLAGLSAEEILKLLPREEIENFLKRQRNASTPPPQ